jgi:hypothetical protein
MKTLTSITVAALSLLAAGAASAAGKAQPLDPANADDQLRIQVKMSCSLVEGTPTLYWWSGRMWARVPGEPNRLLFNVHGMNMRQCRVKQDPVRGFCYRSVSREVMLYLDPVTNEVVRRWKNPWSSEEVDVVHVANDPFNYMIEDHFPAMSDFGGLNKEQPPKIPFILPWYQHGDMAEMEIHVHLAYPSALQPDKWPRESAGPIAQVSEFFAHHIRVEDLQNPKLTSLDYTGTWNRITPWLPWMLMGQAPGMCQYACFMGTTRDLESVLTRPVLDYAHKNYAKYFDAPTEWRADRSLSSLEHYAKDQKPAPARK